MTTNNNIADAQLEFGKDLALRTQPKDVTEQKIRECYIKYRNMEPNEHSVHFRDFKAGYLALLNELEPFTYYDEIQTYRLPEVVTKP
mgnify:CR=1 FL=1